jgi:hypothetical protein
MAQRITPKLVFYGFIILFRAFPSMLLVLLAVSFLFLNQ